MTPAQMDALSLHFNKQLNPGGNVELRSDGMIHVNNPTPEVVGGGIGTPAAPVGPSRTQLDPLFASLDSLDTILANKNKQSRDEYGRAIAGYDGQFALDKKAYGDNTVQNESTYTGNNQAALLNAANAGTGLRGVLSSLGGLAGSGMDVVQRLVGLAANQDAGAARQTFDVNATNLNQAWGQAEQQDKQRRLDADALLENNLQNNEAGVLTSRQNIYQQLANLYGDTAPEGKTYASKASALSAPIAKTTKATVAPYAKASTLFSPGELQSYLAGTQNLNVDSTAPAGNSATPVNSPIFGTQQRKDRLAGVA